MRLLTKPEQDLITYLLADDPQWVHLVNKLPRLMVEEMQDGGMGSLRFLSDARDKVIMQKEIARIDSLKDIDGVYLSITINLGTDNELFELDIFKADFSPLKKFPATPFKTD